MTRPRSSPAELALIRARLLANIEDAPTRALRDHAKQVLADWDTRRSRSTVRNTDSPFARFERALATTTP